jgi:hypothetical protein
LDVHLLVVVYLVDPGQQEVGFRLPVRREEVEDMILFFAIIFRLEALE